jgi:hypothetical protein
VFLGGTVGAAAVVTLLRRRPGKQTALAVSIITSFLLGVFNASVLHSRDLAALVSVGILGTAASFLLVADIGQTVPTDISGAGRLLRRVAGAMVAQAFLCATFATTGYLSIDFAVEVYRKLLSD